jgi:hypothetical protein
VYLRRKARTDFRIICCGNTAVGCTLDVRVSGTLQVQILSQERVLKAVTCKMLYCWVKMPVASILGGWRSRVSAVVVITTRDWQLRPNEWKLSQCLCQIVSDQEKHDRNVTGYRALALPLTSWHWTETYARFRTAFIINIVLLWWLG